MIFLSFKCFDFDVVPEEVERICNFPDAPGTLPVFFCKGYGNRFFNPVYQENTGQRYPLFAAISLRMD